MRNSLSLLIYFFIQAPEIKKQCPGIPYILVGSNSKLRDDFNEHADEYKSEGWEPVPTEKGEEMKEKIGAMDYLECDADSHYNVKEVIETAIEVAIQNQGKPKEKTKKVSKFQQWKEKRKEKKSKKD